MKNNSINLNKEILEKWIGDTLYLIEVFSSVIEELGLVVKEINSNHLIFIGDGFKVKFKYDINRYGGRVLNDVEIDKLGIIYKLSTFVKEEERSLIKIIALNSKKSIAPLETFRNLFCEYLIRFVNQIDT